MPGSMPTKEAWGGPTTSQIAARDRLARELAQGRHRKLDDGEEHDTSPFFAITVAGLGLQALAIILGAGHSGSG
jgi:hypothetical protein